MEKDKLTCEDPSSIIGEESLIKLHSVTNIREDDASLTTFLTARPAPFEDVSGTIDVDFGYITPYAHSQRLGKRGFLDGIGDVILGNWEFSKSATFDVSAGTPGAVSNIYTGGK